MVGDEPMQDEVSEASSSVILLMTLVFFALSRQDGKIPLKSKFGKADKNMRVH